MGRDLDEVVKQEEEEVVEPVEEWAQPTAQPAEIAADAFTAFPTDADVPEVWADLEYQDGAVPAQPQAGAPTTAGMPQQGMMQGQYAQTGYPEQGYLDEKQQMAARQDAANKPSQQDPVMPTSYFPPEANDETW